MKTVRWFEEVIVILSLVVVGMAHYGFGVIPALYVAFAVIILCLASIRNNQHSKEEEK
jgi:hypothetical protein